MFYYISFLKAPPRESQLSQPISITCQISNDLRTELCPHELDVYYSYILEENDADTGTLNQAARFRDNASFVKLTTWRPSTAYKEVRIPPPKLVKDGQRWRLVLCRDPSVSERAMINISRKPFGRSPLPVISMPILFVSKLNQSSTSRGKQEAIERVFSLDHDKFDNANMDAETETYFVIREKLSFDLDKKLWDSGIGLSSWLISSAIRALPVDVMDRLFKKSAVNIIELGSGTGIVSIVLAAILSYQDEERTRMKKIIATDLPSAMELIEHNISANENLYSTARPQAIVLDWDEDTLPQEIQDMNEIDFIIMADVTYNTSSFPSLIRTLQRLREINDKSQSEPPYVLLGYKERDPDERSLWDLLRDVGLELNEVDRVGGAGGAPVEVYLGKFVDGRVER